MPYSIAIDARKIRDFGIGTYTRNLIFELAELDRDNHYYLLAHPDGQELLEDLPLNFEVVTHRSPVYSIRELYAVSMKLLKLKVDLYHATHYVLPWVVPCRTVVTIHDIIHLLYPEFLPNRLAFFYAERMIRHGLKRGDRVITVSHNTRSDLMSYFGVDGRRIEVVYNGIEKLYHQRLEKAELSAALGRLGLAEPYLLFVGNPKPHKNLDRVIQAYAQARQQLNFPHPLVCVGDRGSIEFKIRQRAEQLGITDQIILLGHLDQQDLPAVYQGASLFLYPTLYEGFGLPVIEAMASGVPVITSNTSALKEIAAGYGRLVNPMDVDAIAGAVVQCLSDQERWDSLRRSGERRARDFSWRRTAERTLEIYRLALDGARPKGSAS